MATSAEKLNGIVKENFDGGQLENITKSLADLQHNVAETSQKLAQDSVDFAKKYPVHTAIGAGVLGFVAGYAVKQFRK